MRPTDELAKCDVNIGMPLSAANPSTQARDWIAACRKGVEHGVAFGPLAHLWWCVLEGVRSEAILDS
jgi:hypothetical protein